MKGSGDTLRKCAALVALYRNGAKMTSTKAAEKLGRDKEGARQLVEELHDAGLLRVVKWEYTNFGDKVKTYEWSEPFMAKDEPEPKLKMILGRDLKAKLSYKAEAR